MYGLYSRQMVFVAKCLIVILVVYLSPQFTNGLTCSCNLCGSRRDTCTTEGRCYTQVLRKINSTDAAVYSYGCFHKEELLPPGRPFKCEPIEILKDVMQIRCCDSADMCNVDNLPILVPSQFMIDAEERSRLTLKYLIIIIPIALVLLISIIVAVILVFKRKTLRCCCARADDDLTVGGNVKQLLVPSTGSNTLVEFLDEDCTGSGPGLPTLIQRTIARQIQLEVIIGQGRYGEVWRGMWYSEAVAVKIFHSREERSWFREAEIYQTVMLRHDNILGFIAVDNKDNGTWTQLWLITEYHRHGSLFDYLNRTTLSLPTLLTMAAGIASGLSHLHIEITGIQGKPGIAHRDLKSKNILVKNDLTCCIADLGLAVKHDQSSNAIDVAENSRVGTARYMAPEVLDGTIDMRNFEAFKRADIYALGLVFWELMRRTNTGSACEEFQLPYYNAVQSDPSYEDMKKVVVGDSKRPEIPTQWRNIEALRTMSQLLPECWSTSPASRLSALRIRKNIAKITDTKPDIET